MNPGEIFAIAFTSLKYNRLRSALTVLGIVIGVFTVISIVSIVQGINRYIAMEIGDLGSNIFSISTVGMPGSDREFYEYRKRNDLTVEDARAIYRSGGAIGRVSHSTHTFATVKYEGGAAQEVLVRGVSKDFIRIRDWTVAAGRPLLDVEYSRGSSVCLVGANVARAIANAESLDRDGHAPLTVSIDGETCRIVGVLESRGSLFGKSLDDFVLLPYRYFERIYGRGKPVIILAQSIRQELIVSAVEDARAVLRARRRIPPGKEDDFFIFTQDLLLQLYGEFTVTAFAVTIAVSFISLLVGGIGIMNIMLVSITERTREIGIRKAVGARRKDIVVQFLAESLAMSLTGGMIGAILGIAIAMVSSRIIIGIPAVIPYWTVFLGFLFSITIGLLFGIFPARRAARMNTLSALRYE
jgi:putative ABC transport system permease protein